MPNSKNNTLKNINIDDLIKKQEEEVKKLQEQERKEKIEKAAKWLIENNGKCWYNNYRDSSAGGREEVLYIEYTTKDKEGTLVQPHSISWGTGRGSTEEVDCSAAEAASFWLQFWKDLKNNNISTIDIKDFRDGSVNSGMNYNDSIFLSNEDIKELRKYFLDKE